MAFDKTQPAPNLSLRLSNPLILANWAALEAALSEEHSFPTNGMHKFVTLVDREGDPETPAAGKSILYAKSGLPYIKNSAGTVRVMIGEGGGETKCWFFQDTAPTGWTIETGCADALLAVKGGTNAYNVAGGTKLAGTWTPAGHAHGVTIGNHAHTTDSHTHLGGLHVHELVIPYSGWNSSGRGHNLKAVMLTGNNGELTDNDYPTVDRTLTSESGGSVATGSGGGGSTSSSGAATVTSASGSESASYRPCANVGIIASLN